MIDRSFDFAIVQRMHSVLEYKHDKHEGPTKHLKITATTMAFELSTDVLSVTFIIKINLPNKKDHNYIKAIKNTSFGCKVIILLPANYRMQGNIIFFFNIHMRSCCIQQW